MSSKRKRSDEEEAVPELEDTEGRLSASAMDKFRTVKKPATVPIRNEELMEFLNSPVERDRDAAIERLRKINPQAAVIFHLLFDKFRATHIQTIWTFPQGGPFWLRSRTGCRTGTEGGYLINWHFKKNPLRYAADKYWEKFVPTPATEAGKRDEWLAIQMYVNYVQQHVNLWFVQQKSYETGRFIFRGVSIPLKKGKRYYLVPVFQAWGIPACRDPFNTYRQISPDFVGVLGGIVLILGEAKIPYAQDRLFLYENEKLYYVTQPLDGLHVLKKCWPTMRFADRVTFSRHFGLNVDTFLLDPHWYNGWFAPRELRYYFGPHMKALQEFVIRLFRFKYPKDSPTPEKLAQLCDEEFIVPGNILYQPPEPRQDAEVEQSSQRKEHREFANSRADGALFPVPSEVAKPPSIYFSEARMIHWRAKTLSLDMHQHASRTYRFPPFHELVKLNPHMNPHSVVPPSQQDYANMIDLGQVLFHLRRELSLRYYVYGCVFARGLRLKHYVHSRQGSYLEECPSFNLRSRFEKCK